MAITSIFWTSSTFLNCVCDAPADVIICVDESKVALPECAEGAGNPGGEFQTIGKPYIEGQVLGVEYLKTTCNQVLYRYELSYDTDQIAVGQVLNSQEVLGVFCKGCFTTWVEALVGQEILVEEADNVITITTQHGCQYSFSLVQE